MAKSKRDTCHTNVVERVGKTFPDLKPTEVDRMTRKYLDLAEKIETAAKEQKLKGKSRQQMYLEKLTEYLEANKIDQQRYLLEQKFTKLALAKSMDTVNGVAQTPSAKAESIKSLIVGGVDAKKGELESIGNYAKVFRVSWENKLKMIDKDGLDLVFRSGEKEEALFKEMWEWAKENVEDRRPGISGDKEAQKIAERLHAVNEQIHFDKRSNGVFLNKTEGFISSFRTNRDKVALANKADWKKMVMETVDHAKVFGDKTAKEIDEFLDGVHSNILYGKREKAIESGADAAIVLAGRSQQTAHTMTGERVFHFKNADMAYKYHKAFGHDTIYQSMMSRINADSRKLAQVKVFGTDAPTGLDRVFNKVSNEFREAALDAEKQLIKTKAQLEKSPGDEFLQKKVATQEKALEKALVDRNEFLDSKKMLLARFAEVEGATAVPAQNAVGRNAQVARTLLTASKLGMASISTVTDPGHVAMVVSSALGENFEKELVNGIKNYSHPTLRKEKVFKAAMIETENKLREPFVGIDGENIEPGMLSKAMDNFFKLNGLTWMSTNGRYSVVDRLVENLHKMKDTGFDSLNKNTKGSLERVGINKNKWEVLRLGEDTFEVDGKTTRFLTPEGVERIPLEKLEKIAEFEKMTPEELRRDVSLKFAILLNSAADSVSLTQTARTRGALLQGSQAGTVTGEAWRFISMIKTPMMAMGDMLRTSMHNNASVPHDKLYKAMLDKNNLMLLAKFAPTMMGLAYIGLSLRAALKGETPPDPRNPQVAMDIFVRSGVGSYYADFMLGEYDRSYRNVVTDISGPGGQFVNQVGKVWSKAIRGEDVGRDAYNLILGSIPGNNHLLFRPIAQFAFLNAIEEEVSPGAMGRRRRRLEEDRGSELLWEGLGL